MARPKHDSIPYASIAVVHLQFFRSFVFTPGPILITVCRTFLSLTHKTPNMKPLLLFLTFAAFLSCGKKETRYMLTTGDYDGTIRMATQALASNKDAKRKQEYVYMLEEAFAKARERDQRDIALWFKDANPQNLEKIYQAYVNLNSRQEQIRPLLPLKLQREGRDAKFAFEDYSDQIVSSKNALAKYLYENSRALIGTKNKDNARRAFDDLMYLKDISPDFKDAAKWAETAKKMGTDFVYVYTKNETNIMIPKRLEDELLDFNAYGLNEKWTTFHGRRQPDVNYDFAIVVAFKQILVSPEQVKETEFAREKRIKTGTRKKTDRRGNVIKDSLGKAIIEDVFKDVKLRVNEFRQFKTARVTASVDYIATKGNQVIQSYPLASEFVFENVYARARGDKRAIEKDYWPLFDNGPVPFPSNEQIVFDTGEDLKAKLKNIISRNKIVR